MIFCNKKRVHPFLNERKTTETILNVLHEQQKVKSQKEEKESNEESKEGRMKGK